jgi:hypothetical protein
LAEERGVGKEWDRDMNSYFHRGRVIAEAGTVLLFLEILSVFN